jgi:hypothetical protein
LSDKGGSDRQQRTGRGAESLEQEEAVVWKGRPSVLPFAVLYGVLGVIIIAALVSLELWFAGSFGMPSLAATLSIGGLSIPYGVETITIALVVLGYLFKLAGLAILRARNSYELRTDGLYINTGIANLENTFISPLAFSDARLIRTISMRLVGRSLIVVEANDKRRFEMKMIKDGLKVQNLIRRNLARPTVRLEHQDVVVPQVR